MKALIFWVVAAIITIASIVGCSADDSAKHDLRQSGPLKNYGQTI